MAGKIFINYRRGDDAGFTQALFLRLEDEFAADSLFMDVEGHIKPGDDFVEVLGRQVAECDVLLAIIGPRWSELLAARAGDPDDFVAVEIKAALDKGKRVIPVLVGSAAMPRADTLPETIRPLARRNAVGLRPERFKADCQGLISALKEQLAAAEQERARSESERRAAEAERQRREAEEAARLAAAEARAREQSAAGLSAEEIRRAEELTNWDFIKDRNDPQALRDHLARFPSGITHLYATTKLESLAWAALGATPTLDQLRSYLDEFPKGASSEIAASRVAALEQQLSESQAAEERRTLENAEWAEIATSTDPTLLKGFIAKWPNGAHVGSAHTRLRELNAERFPFGVVSLVGCLVLALLIFIGMPVRHGLMPWNWRLNTTFAGDKILEAPSADEETCVESCRNQPLCTGVVRKSIYGGMADCIQFQGPVRFVPFTGYIAFRMR